MKQYEMYNIQAKHFKQFISKLFARFEKISLMKGEFARNKVYHHFSIIIINRSGSGHWTVNHIGPQSF